MISFFVGIISQLRWKVLPVSCHSEFPTNNMSLCVCTSLDCKVILSYPRWWDDFKHNLALRTNYVIFTVLCLVFLSWMKIFLSEHCYQTLLISIEIVHKNILVNNAIDVQFFKYVYFYSLHVSGSRVPIIGRIIVSMRHLVYVTWKRAYFLRPCCVEYTTTHKTLCPQIACDLWAPCFVSCNAFHTAGTKKMWSFPSDINQVSHWYNNSPVDWHTAARNL